MPDDFDHAALIAGVRRKDAKAIERAYLETFGSDLGRIVLAHHLVECGVGMLMGSGPDLPYNAGRHDAAIVLATAAGFDQAAIAVATLTDTLEGSIHEQTFVDPDEDLEVLRD